jgi:hypothetical protein
MNRPSGLMDGASPAAGLPSGKREINVVVGWHDVETPIHVSLR